MSCVIIQINDYPAISESNCFFFDKFLMNEPLTTTFMLSMIILSINQSPCEQRFKIVVFSIGTLYTKLSMISLISEEKMIAKRRTNMTADTIIKVVSHMNQMEKNF